jgi:hypothetical protein
LKPQLAGVRGNSASAILSDIRLSRDHDARGVPAFIGLPGFVLGIAAVASAVAARRAIRVDPMTALRCE